ncbi:MAG: DUF222 domain-containing protein [Marmoricola sp.]
MTFSSSDVTTAGPAAELRAFLERVARFDVAGLDQTQQADLLQACTRAEAGLTALRMRVIAAADRTRTPAASGAASAADWAAKISNSDPAHAHRQVGLAHGLERRTRTQRALSSGEISAEHAAVIIRADKDLPAGLGAEERDQVEAALLDKARVVAPAALRRLAGRALAAVEPDPVRVDAHEDALVRSAEEQARAKTRLSMRENDDGTISGWFTVPVAHGELLRKVLQTITAPRRGRLGAAAAQVGEREERTDWDRARGLALCELIEHLPTEHLHPKTAATLVVMIDESVLRGALKAAGLDTGGLLSAGEARRFACNARILPVVLDGASQALDLGRSKRLFNEAQRIAKGLEHDTCAADGCERPYAWCELHHKHHWAHGGCSDLDEAVPLCHFHHQRIHDPGYGHAYRPGGSITFHLLVEESHASRTR